MKYIFGGLIGLFSTILCSIILPHIGVSDLNIAFSSLALSGLVFLTGTDNK